MSGVRSIYTRHRDRSCPLHHHSRMGSIPDNTQKHCPLAFSPVYLAVRELDDLVYHGPQLALHLSEGLSRGARQLAPHALHHHLEVRLATELLGLCVGEVVVGMEGEVEGLAEVEERREIDCVAHVRLRNGADGAGVARHSDVDGREGAAWGRVGEGGAIGLRGRQRLEAGGAGVAVLVADLLHDLLLCFDHLARVALHSTQGMCVHV